jgi:hypothetical protein
MAFRILKFLRDKLGITALEQENNSLKYQLSVQSTRLDRRIAELDELTAVDADVGVRGPCTVILTGVYRGNGYVKFYEMPVDEFRRHVDMMLDMQRSSLIRTVDAPPSFMASFPI